MLTSATWLGVSVLILTTVPALPNATISGVPRAVGSAAVTWSPSGHASTRHTAPADDPIRAGLAAYYKLDESSGRRDDATGNGHVLTEAGNNLPIVSATGVLILAAAPTAVDFQSLTTVSPDDVASGPNKLSVSFWYNSNSDAGATRGLLGNWFYTSNVGSWAVESVTGVMHNYVKVPGASASSFEDGTYTIPTNNSSFHHVVYVFDGTQTGDANRLKVYWDATQQTLAFSGPLGSVPAAMANDDSILAIGQDLIGLGRFSGYKFDEVGIWNERALAQADVTRLFGGGAGLKLY